MIKEERRRKKRRKIYDDVVATFTDYCVFVGGSSMFLPWKTLSWREMNCTAPHRLKTWC